ncbi:pyridoxal phosphate-dependent aminotransferase [Streptomyces sp. NRRL B-3229]|uniref:pyridoxal phosphate-dependent aminotransferase n=1 Tax=Streptomyces sp. NRRL B-3229 TaxID=1463836 RepID=UPI0005639F34|nr:pyridoxal phosphate-dependent aminotransferase [Streptomyces sp. NRRL B-3229]
MPLPSPSDAVTRLLTGSLRPAGGPPTGEPALLGVGEPDFATPEPIVRAAAEALAAGWTHYGDLNGDPELRALAARLASESADTPYRSQQVLVTNGATSAVSAAVASTVSPGDRVVLLDPSYSLFSSAVLMAGGEPVYVPFDATGHLDLERIAEALPGAKALILVNPANPVGTVFHRTELEALADLTQRHGTVVIADEVCDHFIFDDRVFTSALAVDTWRDRLVYCQSLSKTYAMTGWRVGYLIAPASMINGIRTLHRTFLGAVNAAAQRAAIVALEGGDAFVKPMRESYQERRDYIVARINAMPELSAAVPEGGFFVLARYDRQTPSLELVASLADHGVVVRPGREFGPAGEGHLRISVASPPTMLETGLDRIEDYFRLTR